MVFYRAAQTNPLSYGGTPNLQFIGFFAKQFIHFIKRDTKSTTNKSLHTFNKKFTV